MKALDAAIQILKEAGGPLHVNEITKRMIAAGLWASGGKTPEATVGASISSDIKKHGEQSSFIKVAPSEFSLHDDRSVVRNTQSPNPRHKTNPRETYSFLDAAEKVLRAFGNQDSMHVKNITDKAIEQRWLSTTGKTPEATMDSQIKRYINQAETNDQPRRFIRTAPRHYGLEEWVDGGISDQVSKHNGEIREQLLSQLKQLKWWQFEELIKELFDRIGFDDPEVTSRGKDGGVDIKGTFKIGGAIPVKVAVQAKKWEGNVSAPTVQKLRGSLDSDQRGLIITTSDFSRGAIEEAKRGTRSSPIILMNGEQLAKILAEYEIGISRGDAYHLFRLEDLPITSENKD